MRLETLQCFFDKLSRLGCIAVAIEFDFLATFRQLLVDAKERFDALAFDQRQVIDIEDLVVSRIDIAASSLSDFSPRR